MDRPVVELLDADVPAAGSGPAERSSRRWWAVGSALAAAVVAVALITPSAPSTDGGDVAVGIVGHTGSALTGQSFVRLYFSVAAYGGDAEIEQVELVLGGGRSDGSSPSLIREGDAATVLVDAVPDCPRALTELPAGALEVTYRGPDGPLLARLPLPIEGSLPRLVQRRCAAIDRT